jgi:alpha-beta hydrolase superfamily lysophospholipase
MEKQSPKKKLRIIFRWVFWVLLVQLILINISAALYAWKFTHVYDDPALRNSPPSSNIIAKTWRLFSGPRQPRSIITEYPSFAFDTVLLKTAKGITIDAWYSKADSMPKGTVLLFHGIMSNKGLILSEASAFRSFGYNVLLVDFRAHGNSGGNTTTIGAKEAEEVKLAVDYTAGLGEKNIYLWGSSMGAVVVAKAVADYNLQPSGIILEMPFASLQSHLQARARALGFQGLPEKPFGFFVSCWIGWERGFNGLKHRTADYVKKIDCPVLLQYGGRDTYVLNRETDRVFEAVHSVNKKKVVYENAGHESLQQNDPAKWDREVKLFLEKK